jgi:hypothetical protein
MSAERRDQIDERTQTPLEEHQIENDVEHRTFIGQLLAELRELRSEALSEQAQYSAQGNDAERLAYARASEQVKTYHRCLDVVEHHHASWIAGRPPLPLRLREQMVPHAGSS